MCGRYMGFVNERQELSDIYTATRSLYPDTLFHSDKIFSQQHRPFSDGEKRCSLTDPCHVNLSRISRQGGYYKHTD